MIQVKLMVARVPVPGAPVENPVYQQAMMDRRAWIDPRRVDTITEVDAEMRRQNHLPDGVRAVVRYDDVRVGYRLMFVGDDPADLVAARRRELNGEDSGDPFGIGGMDPA